MMKKDNRSLLSRLVGGQNGNQQGVYDDQDDVNYEVEADEGELLEEQEVEVEEEEESVPIQVPVSTDPQTQTRQDGWMSDFEGQLNIDMYQTKDNVIIKSTVAGVRPEDLDITVANDVLTIKGSRKREEEVPQDDYFYQECYWGSFSRSVIVPVDIDSEHIEADLKDGMLTIIVPKAAKAKTKKVKVRGM